MKITEALVAEHTIFLGVFDQIERALPSLTTVAEVRTMGSIVEGLLETHGETETNLAYAALDHLLADKGKLDKLHQDHQEIDASLRDVQAASNLGEARRRLKTALTYTRKHFRHEEKLIFPLIEKAVHKDTLLDLGKVWVERFRTAPTVA